MRAEDAGRYSCKASNEVGEDWLHYELLVLSECREGGGVGAAGWGSLCRARSPEFPVGPEPAEPLTLGAVASWEGLVSRHRSPRHCPQPRAHPSPGAWPLLTLSPPPSPACDLG